MIACMLYMPAVVFGETQSKTDEEWDSALILEKLEQISGAFEHIVGQENFHKATYYTYDLLLNAIAQSPIGSTTFLHGESAIGVFDITIATQIMDGQLFHVGRLSYKKNLLASPLYDATLLWNMWSNEEDNKVFMLHIFSKADKDMLVSRLIQFPIEENKLGNPVFVFQETLGGGLHTAIGVAKDTNQDGVVDFIQIDETYLNVEKKIVAKKLGGSLRAGTSWNDVEVCQNGVCKKIKFG